MSRVAYNELTFTAALIDLDGTLADSLPALRSAYHAFLRSHGRVGSDADFERYNGPPLDVAVRLLVEDRHIDGAFEPLLDEYRALVTAAYQRSAALAAGAAALLDTCAELGLRLALVTSAPAELAQAWLEAKELRDRFDVVVTGDDVARGKPDPQPYQRALRLLGVKRAIALEDSAAGVCSALAAGVLCVALGDHPGAAVCVGSLHEATAVIRDLCHPSGALIAAHELELVHDAEPLCWDDQTNREIDAIWEATVKAGPSAFDDGIVSVSRWHVGGGRLTLVTRPARYRHFIAQRHGMSLGIRSLCVSGLTMTSSGHIAVGQRSPNVTQFPGCWELIPAGNVPAEVDVEAQLAEELREELGDDDITIRRVTLLGALDDAAEHTLDLLYRIDTDIDHEIASGDEYDAVETLSLAELCEVLEERRFVPTARALLDRMRNQWTFVPASDDDLSFLCALRNEEQAAKFSRRGRLPEAVVARDYLHHASKRNFVACLSGQRVAYVIFEDIDAGSFEISIAVDAAHRRRGHGTSLIVAATQHAIQKLGAQSIRAEIFSANEPSKHAFSRAGYWLEDESCEPQRWRYVPSVVSQA